MKKSDKIVGGLALLSAAIVVIKLAGVMTGYDLFQMAVDATRPRDAGGWLAATLMKNCAEAECGSMVRAMATVYLSLERPLSASFWMLGRRYPLPRRG